MIQFKSLKFLSFFASWYMHHWPAIQSLGFVWMQTEEVPWREFHCWLLCSSIPGVKPTLMKVILTTCIPVENSKYIIFKYNYAFNFWFVTVCEAFQFRNAVLQVKGFWGRLYFFPSDEMYIHVFRHAFILCILYYTDFILQNYVLDILEFQILL